MVSFVRKAFNDAFSVDKYNAFLKDLDNHYPGAIEFRLAETPIFVPVEFTNKMIFACESIIDFIKSPAFLQLTANSIPEFDKVPGEYGLPQMMVFDFGVCRTEEGLVPQLVEMQGFPSLYGFQDVYPNILRKHFSIPGNFTHYLGGHNHETYTQFLTDVIVGEHDPENVILLEIKPHEQKTKIDFYCTEQLTGVTPVCVTELSTDGKNLFYERGGQRTLVKRIYNRVIFDELHRRSDLGDIIDIKKEYDVEWVTHPDWFYRISKYTLPLIHHPYVPKTFFLHELKQPPGDLENYVLKPLFSFAGQGVVIDVSPEDIANISDPENWILQKKVPYADVIETPGAPAKTEIRIMYLWKTGADRPEPVINLARLSKGKMIGTRYNKNHDWVGGSVAFFER